jgi:hypothetical protein
MVRAIVVFALIIHKVFLPWVPFKGRHFLCNFIPNPEESNFHRSRTLPFDGIICYAHGCCVVTMDGSLWLWVPHVAEGESKDHARLTVVVKGTQFGLSC